jgi:hypothetical protein
MHVCSHEGDGNTMHTVVEGIVTLIQFVQWARQQGGTCGCRDTVRCRHVSVIVVGSGA